MPSYHELKRLIFVLETLLGMFLTAIAWWLLSPPGTPIVSAVVGIIIGITGLAGVLFGVTTFIIRNDPDVWR